MGKETISENTPSVLPDDYADVRPLTAVPDSTSEMPVYTGPGVENGEEQSSESPKNLFMQAYEAVRTTDKVSTIVDNVAIWWKGRHIDAIEKDIQRLEALASTQSAEASRHEQRLQASNDAALELGRIKNELGVNQVDHSQAANRGDEYAAVKARAESHAATAENINRELAKKRELKEQFERDREGARGRVAERFQNNINANIEVIRNIDSQVDQMQQNLGVADKIVASLQEKQEVARAFLNNPSTLSVDKQMAKSLVQDLEGRIQDMKSAMQIQQEKIAVCDRKKSTLENQKLTWEARIAKKPEQAKVGNEEVSDTEKEESFVAETTKQITEREDALMGDEAETATIEKDPRVVMIEELRDLIHQPELERYDSPDFQDVILENGTPEEKVLVRTYGMFTRMFNFLESSSGHNQESEELDPVSFAREYDEVIDDYIDNPEIALLFDSDNRENIEKGNGTPEQQFLVKLFMFFEYIFSSMDIRTESKKSDKNLI
ncbi:MAG: hypothetical protein K8Q97_03965 [Candidatus Andersenbacteria bacterium]|nr:hypothetical protein [Candidatus Andersenbacteria bacterium]